MASISITEDDFQHLAMAASRAMRAGNEREAKALDKMARKASAALTTEKYKGYALLAGPGVKRHTWKDVPSTLTD